MSASMLRVGVLATHPVQYYSPWYRALASQVDLEVFFCHRQTAEAQGDAGFGVPFAWDVPLLEGYRSTFLSNVATHPGVSTFWGCNTPALPAIIKGRRFDAFIVHGWSALSFWQAIIACWRTGTPVFVRGDSHLSTPRAWWWRMLKAPVYRAFIPRFDGYLVVGQRAKAYFVHYGADPARCVEAPHSVDNQFFASACARLRPERSRLRHAFGLPEEAVVFLFAGKFLDVKQPMLFAEAVAKASRHTPAVAGLMVGDGPLRGEVEALVDRLGAPIRFTGFLNQTEMPRAYAMSDVLVVPSTSETWGLVVNEAMACGLPAIASDGVGCVGDLVLAHVTGEVFASGSLKDLSGHLVALARDACLRSRLGAAATSRVAEFDVSASVAGTVRGVRELAAARVDGRGPGSISAVAQ